MSAVAPNDREGLTPVTLTPEQPVTQSVIDGFFPDALLVQPVGDFALGFGVDSPSKKARVLGHTVLDKQDRGRNRGLNDIHELQMPNFSANSKSRSSWPGTAMIAPVP